MKYVVFFLAIALPFYLISCDNDEYESPISPSLTLIEMEGEGGRTEISITGEEWSIVQVINRDGNKNISGDSYSIDGDQILKNYTLSLDGLGQMDALWTDKGFSIIRNTPTSLEVIVKENSTGEDFSFVIVLKSGDKLKDITINQKKSKGYQFECIEYSLKEHNGDSIFVMKGMNHKFNIPSPQEFLLSPFNEFDIVTNSYFESIEEDAFVWTENDSIMVKTPSEIWNNEVLTNGEKSRYTNASTIKDCDYKNQMRTLVIPSGESAFYVEIQYRKRKISYTLYLINNRTNDKKIIEGKWIELAPTGHYTIIWKD